jgi:hypothetical protein
MDIELHLQIRPNFPIVLQHIAATPIQVTDDHPRKKYQGGVAYCHDEVVVGKIPEHLP